MEYLIIPLVVLAVATAFTFYYGRKKNQWIATQTASILEDRLQPYHTRYIDIGGSIGYHFTYKRHNPFKEVRGTITLLARQSLFYFPISRLILKQDRLYLTFYTKENVLGEGHLLEYTYYSHMKDEITNRDMLQYEEVKIGTMKYVLLWEYTALYIILKELLTELQRYSHWFHLCCYGPNQSVYLYCKPDLKKLSAFINVICNASVSFLSSRISEDNSC